MTPVDQQDPAVRARSEAAAALTSYLEKTAEAIDAEQRKFPAMSSLPKPLDIDPDMIGDFTLSAAYKQAVEDYVAGRVEQNLLITVLKMLRGLVPALFGGL